MKYLIDTHTFIWFTAGDTQLSTISSEIIESTQNDIFLSIASVWEMAIKSSIGKLDINKPFEQIFEDVQNNKMKLLPIRFKDTLLISKLPFHRKDPFDRIIIAQAISLSVPIIGKDEIFKSYGIDLIW
jgi:PIN domain nuclease of toxin-antitoxin system